MKFWYLIAFLLTLNGCVSVHEGHRARVHGGEEVPGLEISAIETSDPKNNPFSLFTVTVENTGGDWLRIDSIEVDFDGEMAKSHSVVLGNDLVSWAEASAEKQRLDDYNAEWIKTGLFGVGMVGALVANHNGNAAGRIAGAALAAGVLGHSGANQIIRDRDRMIQASTIPEKHLYLPFSVPSKLFIRRWVLINKPSDNQLTALGLIVRTVDGKVSRVTVPLQRPRCADQGVRQC